MNRTTLFRSLSLGLASLALATASLAGTFEQAQLDAARSIALDDTQLANDLQAWVNAREAAEFAAARSMALDDAQIANELQAWVNAQQDVALLAQADGLVTNDMREQVARLAVARIAAADGLVVDTPELMASQPESEPATRNPGAVLLATAKTKR